MKVGVIEEHPDFQPRNKRGIWIYRLEHDFSYRSPFAGSAFSARWLKIARDGTIKVPRGYAWDGCTPKFALLDVLILGVPDGIVSLRTAKPKTYYASLVHDALYQYFAWHHVPRRETDRLFLEMMRLEDFSLAGIYYVVTRALGGFFVPEKHPARSEVVFERHGQEG